MAILGVTLTDGGFPDDFSGDLELFKDTILSNIVATVDSANLILGKIGGTAPTTNVGLWLDNGILKAWSSGVWVPIKIAAGDSTNVTFIAASTLTADRTITVQDKSGTLALTSDLYNGRATVTIGSPPVIDWSLSNNFYQLLSANLSPTFTNSLSGQGIWVALVNNATSFTVTWPTDIAWVGNVIPAQTASKTDLYFFENVAGTIYGKQYAGFA